MYDLLILGGGPAGYRAAEQAARRGLSTVLFEERAVGGVCLQEGCIPTKTLLHTAKLFEYANGGSVRYGVACDNPRLEYAAAVKRKNKVVKKLTLGVEASLRDAGAVVVRERAAVRGRTATGFAAAAGGQAFEGKRLLLCAGSKPILPPVEGLPAALETGFALTTREFLGLTELPETLAIVGGGVIGLEMASLMASAGRRVTVIELMDKVAGSAEAEISALLQKHCEKKGVTFLLHTKLVRVEEGVAICERDGETLTVPCARLLLAAGRRPSTEGLGLEALGVRMERGAVVTDGSLRTNIPGVYAAGDINGMSMLAHTAYREADAAVTTICGEADAVDYNAVPSVIYTNPEAAFVGETLASARGKGFPAHELRLPMTFSGRFLAENEGGDGLCKLIVCEDRLIGAHMLGNPCSEIISSAAMAISAGLTVEQLKRVTFPHPSVSEILTETLLRALPESGATA